MGNSKIKDAKLLIEGISQFDVDFVIPRLGYDLPLWIDPFLLYKSRNNIFNDLHSRLLEVFQLGIHDLRNGKIDNTRDLFRFPEVVEIGLGYTKTGRKGGGLGTYFTELIIDSLTNSPALLDRGIKHIEELQLISLGIAADRISDITANILKQYLIEYTQEQCDLWNIPVKAGVPINHIYDIKTGDWSDGYFDLPVNPKDHSGILFVPRRIVRVLPWINYDEFCRSEFPTFLRSKHTKSKLATSKKGFIESADHKLKPSIISVSRKEIDHINRYIQLKEENAANAQPSLNYLEDDDMCKQSAVLKDRLSQTRVGREDSNSFQMLVLEILNFLFNPQLIDGKTEVKTIDGTERRDIVFTNDSDFSFWSYLRQEHSSFLIMFEAKNTNEITNANINQTATYLGDRLGRLGFIVTRYPINDERQKKIFSVYNDGGPRKIILVLSDSDITAMLDQKCNGKEPMRYLQNLYRAFRTSAQ